MVTKATKYTKEAYYTFLVLMELKRKCFTSLNTHLFVPKLGFSNLLSS
jgi:hypothetical protein